jgi:hypothetical protein
MQLHVFGASTPTGFALREQADSAIWVSQVFAYSRGPADQLGPLFPADFTDPGSFWPLGDPESSALWVSLGPIWLLAPFLEELTEHFPDRIKNLRGIVACSSSSVLTKRFAVSDFDRDLVQRLASAEECLHAISLRLQIPCFILRPTLIYGQAGPYGDRNLSRLLKLLRRLPCLILPAETGLRQPIHSSQLAAVALHIAEQLCGFASDAHLGERITLGGDSTLTYAAMISALQEAQSAGDPARRCRLLPIPNRLFFSLAAPLLLRSPKAFEAVLRMGANLSGFTPAHQLLGREPQPFPVLPLA